MTFNITYIFKTFSHQSHWSISHKILLYRYIIYPTWCLNVSLRRGRENSGMLRMMQKVSKIHRRIMRREKNNLKPSSVQASMFTVVKLPAKLYQFIATHLKKKEIYFCWSTLQAVASNIFKISQGHNATAII